MREGAVPATSISHGGSSGGSGGGGRFPAAVGGPAEAKDAEEEEKTTASVDGDSGVSPSRSADEAGSGELAQNTEAHTVAQQVFDEATDHEAAAAALFPEHDVGFSGV